MKPNLTHQDKVIITIATTGGLHGREANPALPEQPDEIVSDFYDCYNAGASVAHIHVRDKEGRTSADLNIYNDVVDGVMGRCSSMITQVGSGIGIWFDEKGDQPQLLARGADEPPRTGAPAGHVDRELRDLPFRPQGRRIPLLQLQGVLFGGLQHLADVPGPAAVDAHGDGAERAADHGGDPRGDGVLAELGAVEVDVDVDATRCCDEAFGVPDRGRRAADQRRVDIVHHRRVPGFPMPAMTPSLMPISAFTTPRTGSITRALQSSMSSDPAALS